MAAGARAEERAPMCVRVEEARARRSVTLQCTERNLYVSSGACR